MIRKSLQRIAFLIAVTCTTLCGCGDAGDKTVPKTDEQQQDKTAKVQPADSSKLLVGIWYGKAILNQDLLAAKLAKLPQAERQQLQQVAAVFQTTEIGARFDAAGLMELDILVKPNGQVLRDSTTGQWKVVEVLDNAVLIETVEPLPAGGTETNRVRYQFAAEGQRAIMVAPTSELLADCSPLFVFERVQQSETGEQAAPLTANGTNVDVR